MFRYQFLEAGDDAKVSPKKVSPKKVSPKKLSPNKEAVFFWSIFFFENGIRIKCHQIGMDQKVSPNNNNNGDNFYLIDIV